MHAPYAPGTPDPTLTQVWIDHIDHVIGVRTKRQAHDMRHCIEQTDRVVNLTNIILVQATELLEEARLINRGQYRGGSSSDSVSPHSTTTTTTLRMFSLAKTPTRTDMVRVILELLGLFRIEGMATVTVTVTAPIDVMQGLEALLIQQSCT
ncbi:hypothetical protein N7517_003981 [Penicillium concentricum]|uniref:Uncharacterized protein n=1 Tax=Penicillium concentricum TaxID=293559 RepID=A0A9W9S4Y5_9EURO|nr:uncharacterized protein N7517_003981 [Penicillium concentricum]KAJ5371975.1 hypothetical protein N7517_003981 [Penicillium concentricum]